MPILFGTTYISPSVIFALISTTLIFWFIIRTILVRWTLSFSQMGSSIRDVIKSYPTELFLTILISPSLSLFADMFNQQSHSTSFSGVAC